MSDLSTDRSLDLPDGVWHTASADEKIEPGSIDFSNLTPETFEELVDGFKAVAHAARRHIGAEANRTLHLRLSKLLRNCKLG